MSKILFSVFYPLLFLFFLVGAGRIALEARRSVSDKVRIRCFLVAVFLFPFLLYFLAGLLGFSFGWARNFFYLLPIYSLVAFYGVKAVLRDRRLFYGFSLLILIVLLSAAVWGSMDWEDENLEREMVRRAAHIKGESTFIFFERGIAKWALMSYAEKSGIPKTLLLNRWDDPSEFARVAEQLSRTRAFAVVEGIYPGQAVKQGMYSLGGRSFEIIKVDQAGNGSGPFECLRNLVNRPSPRVVIYYLRRAQSG